MGEARIRPPGLKDRVRLAWHRLRGGNLSPLRATLSVAVGLFIGVMPIYGFQLLLVLAVCIPMRLDAAIAYLAAHVSNPITLPVMLWLEIEIGSLVLTGEPASIGTIDLEHLGTAGRQLILGSLVLGTGLSLIGGAITFVLSARRAGNDPTQAAIERVERRYAGAGPRDRIYVRAKLEVDPLPRLLTTLAGPFGRVTDAGAGLGQLGLFLLEIGKATRITGFDPEPHLVQVAQAAAPPEATFHRSSFRDFAWPEADTVLFADSLHYANIEDQDAALASAAASLAAGGRIVVREVDARPSWRSALSRFTERVSARLRARGALRGFRSTESLTAQLYSLGLTVSRVEPEEWSPFENAVLLAERPGTADAA